MNVLVLGGPNLNLLGTREPEVYGKDTLKDIELFIEKSFEKRGFVIEWFQSNSESKLIEKIHESIDKQDSIIINPAGLTHTSVSLYDALKAFQGTKLEVHLSNTYQREDFRKQKVTSGASDGVIEGFGKMSYFLAFQYLLEKINGE